MISMLSSNQVNAVSLEPESCLDRRGSAGVDAFSTYNLTNYKATPLATATTMPRETRAANYSNLSVHKRTANVLMFLVLFYLSAPHLAHPPLQTLPYCTVYYTISILTTAATCRSL
jgi:hypothetical protein